MIDASSTRVRIAVLAGSSLLTLIVLSVTSSPSPGQSPARQSTTTTAPAVPLVDGEYAAERLTFRYPRTWTFDPAKDETGPTLYLQEPGGIAAWWAVAARKVPPEETLEALVERVAQGMGTIHREFKLRDKGVVTAADGTRRGFVEYDYAPEPGARAVQRQILLPGGAGRIINVTEAGSPQRWERDGATMRQITESLRLAPPR